MRGGNNMTEPSQYFKGRTVQEQMNEVIGYVDTRAAEVATTAIASDVAQVHQDMLDADADASAAAASAAAAAGTLANAVKKTGEASQSIAGDIAVAGNLSGGTVTVPTPTNNTNAANKKYVDDADALKADKTYVDAQDTLKLNITDVGNYAVLLTGNQTNILGQKSFENNVYQGVNIGSASAGWRCVAKLPASTSGTSVIIMVAGHGSAIFNLLHYQCRNHVPRLVSIATTGDYNGKIAVASDGTDEYLYVNSTSNLEIYPLGGNRTVPLRLDNLPTTQYATDEDLTAAYTAVVIV